MEVGAGGRAGGEYMKSLREREMQMIMQEHTYILQQQQHKVCTGV